MKIVIIGGGLSGLALAEMLQARGADYHVLEARDRLGGRILTESVGAAQFDMGPAWFWPGQPRIDATVRRLGLHRFDQFATGDVVAEDPHGRVVRGQGYASMAGSWRLDGGLSALTDALADRLDPARLQTGARVTGISRLGDQLRLTLDHGAEMQADRVVLAMPPRIAATLAFSPALAPAQMTALSGVPTWMAGQAKAVAVYDSPFWRDAGLSGDAMSRRGPMVEIHDASPADGSRFALFGFIGIPVHARTDTAALRVAVTDQLARLFGPKAAEPQAVFLKDWAYDPLTATPADAEPLMMHPTYGLPPVLRDIWSGQVVLAGTEVGAGFGGYLEGALEAAEAAAARLLA